MYPPGSTVTVAENSISRDYEGAERPGHFEGVLTVVAKLFNIVRPDVAVFGQKDAQQLCAVRKMVRDLNIIVDIVPGPTIREPDGLAMSSRNVYLSPEEREQALALRRALDQAEIMFNADSRNADAIKQTMASLVAEYPLVTPDYIEIVDSDDFQPVRVAEAGHTVIIAGRLGKTRLLDNTVLKST